MYKFKSLIGILLISIKSQALMDYLAKKSEDVLKTAMYADAIADLVGEITPDTELEKRAKSTRDLGLKLNQDLNNLYYIGEDTKSVLNGPDLGSESLETNIRASTNYIRKVKRLGLKVAALGTDGFTALNSLQTNDTLEQIRKNQALEIAIVQSHAQKQIVKNAMEEAKMRNFIAKQRSIRRVNNSQVM